MSDAIWAAAWVSVLFGGLAACVLAHRLGLSSTHARDLLHVGTGVWVLGFPLWNGHLAPLAIPASAAVITACVPLLARRNRRIARLMKVFASGEERWSGLTLYALSYATLTALGVYLGWFTAAVGLLALSLGDGIGGAVGTRLGTHTYRAPGGKVKSVEGSIAVAGASAAGVLIASWRFDVPVEPRAVAGLGVAAAVAEALSPRGTDNVLVPAIVWGLAQGIRT